MNEPCEILKNIRNGTFRLVCCVLFSRLFSHKIIAQSVLVDRFFFFFYHRVAFILSQINFYQFGFVETFFFFCNVSIMFRQPYT